jgi:hypothetical protein
MELILQLVFPERIVTPVSGSAEALMKSFLSPLKRLLVKNLSLFRFRILTLQVFYFRLGHGAGLDRIRRFAAKTGEEIE